MEVVYKEGYIECLVCHNVSGAGIHSPHGMMSLLMQRGYTLEQVQHIRNQSNFISALQKLLEKPQDLFS